MSLKFMGDILLPGKDNSQTPAWGQCKIRIPYSPAPGMWLCRYEKTIEKGSGICI